jgi:hypothetical protein
MMRAWRISRWSMYVCFAWGEHCVCVAQKLPYPLVFAHAIGVETQLGCMSMWRWRWRYEAR